MRQERSQHASSATRRTAKRLILFSLLIATAVILSSCYTTDPDRLLDNNGLDLGTGAQQQFEAIMTPTPSVTVTPTPAPTTAGGGGNQVNWNDWDFGDTGNATNPPANVIDVGGTVQPTQPGATGGVTTPQPQSTITGTTTSTSLKTGSAGEAVKQVQQRLKDLGYYNGSVDGQYGSGTANAVRDFQAANNLTADGVAGKSTQETLYGYYAIAKKDATKTAPPTQKPSGGGGGATTKATPKPVESVNGRTDIYLKLGDSGAQVKTMQNRLIALGYISGSADGEFGSTTEAAVISFQKRNSIYADGIAGPSTLSKMYGSGAKKASSVVSNLGSLKRGMNGGAVRSLQDQLRTLGFYNGSTDGDYGAGTEAAVIAFQQANGLKADGVAGTATMNAIFGGGGGGGGGGSGGGGSSNPETYGKTAKTNGYTTISAATTSKPNVTALQSVLQSLNYYSGTLDGSYGSGTEAAVKEYQRAAGLRVTGMAGPSTQRLLYGGASESGSYAKLEVGSTGSAVRSLQYTLYELKYYDGDINGNFDEATRNAVMNFQQCNGLSVDGVAGQDTQRRLYSSSAIPSNL